MEKKKLSEEARLKRNEYMRNYRRNNKDKIAEYNRTYWEKRASESKEA